MNAYHQNLLEKLLTTPKSALIVVDVQNDYIHPDGVFAKKGLVNSEIYAMMPNLQRLIQSARSQSVPVIFIQTTHQDETDSEVWLSHSGGVVNPCCRRGTWGAEFYEVEPQPGDIIVNKHRYSAFVNTRLDTVLRTLKIDTAIIAGIMTNVCVESTARDAYSRDYFVVLVEDCCAASTRAEHEMTMHNAEQCFGIVASREQIEAIWSVSQK